ncbi:MAG: hypothetical protein H6840_10785 [Planctomycetes bacterium]|nr:hypothetical protein [Planctomycetota bacterium]
MARGLAPSDGYDEYTTLTLVRVGFQLIGSPVADDGSRVRVHCAVCSQRYMGSRERIKALKKCMRCGHTPFQAADVPDGDQP